MSTPFKAAFFAILLALAVLFWFWSYAKADMLVRECGAPEGIRNTLSKYKEVCAEPLEMKGKTLLFCKNERTGTWTMIEINSRETCVIAVGRDRRPAT